MSDDHTLIRRTITELDAIAVADGWPAGSQASRLIERLVRERDEARKALREAIEFAEEGWGYAHDYYKQKWEYEKTIGRLRALAAAQTEVKT